MFPEVEDQAMGEVVAVASAGTDQLDLEAAEQLIQLSGGDGGDSETKSADSVKCSREKDKEVVVESRRRSDESFPAQKDGAEDCDGLVDDGEARRRPRFRSLADIYRETTTKKRAVGEEGGSPRKMKRAADEEGGSPRKKKTAGNEVTPVVASKEIRRDLVGVVNTRA